MSTLNDSARSLLIEALSAAEIPQLDEAKTRSLFSSIYWLENQHGQIEILLTTWHFNTGILHADIKPTDLVEHIQRLFSDRNDQLAAVVDALQYIKAVTFTLLPITQNKLLKRAYGARLPSSDSGGLAALFEMMQAAFTDNRALAEKKLEGKRLSRGGSDPRLESKVRDSLHIEYDQLHGVTREVKKDYRNLLKAYTKANQKLGFSRVQWAAYWTEHCGEKYPAHLRDLLQIFVKDDDLSAAQIAYEYLASQLGHTASYIQTLVRDSRKKAVTINPSD